MFGPTKNDDLKQATKELRRETGLTLDDIPEKEPVEALFRKMTNEQQFTHESKVALLYRLVAMNFLVACKILRDKGYDTPPEKLIWLTEILDRSVDWAEKAEDQIALEQSTSHLNSNILRFMASFGISQGKRRI